MLIVWIIIKKDSLLWHFHEIHPFSPQTLFLLVHFLPHSPNILQLYIYLHLVRVALLFCAIVLGILSFVCLFVCFSVEVDSFTSGRSTLCPPELCKIPFQVGCCMLGTKMYLCLKYRNIPISLSLKVKIQEDCQDSK